MIKILTISSNYFIEFMRIWYSFSMKRAITMLNRKSTASIEIRLATRGIVGPTKAWN